MKSSIVKSPLIFPFLFQIILGQISTSIQIDSYPVPVDSTTATFLLSKNFILESTLRITLDSTNWNNYSYQKSTNSVTIKFDTLIFHPSFVYISYSYLPLQLKPVYSLRSLVLKTDSVTKKKARTIVTQSEGAFSNMFGPELSKSGSITRGFMVGSNRDLTLSSGFRLQMAGKLSSDIEILAALTDENTPIQPQGNTQTLQEIDNVFVEIKSPTYSATLGDFQFSSSGSEFANVNRKLQGARLSADYQSLTPQTEATITGATSRGKFHTNQFSGIEGVQGPYRLIGKNNEGNIIVIAGSEKVYVDGVEMVRGDNNDYSIDYGSAEVTFSTRRLITGASRIVIDFEYSDRQFTRNFIGAGASSKLSNSVSLRAQFYREGDDPDAPIDIALNDSDKIILQQAGNNPPAKPGVIFVGSDSLGIGRGNYSAKDTTINGEPYTMYRFEQGTTQSIYNVAFSNVGFGRGDYIREGIGRYRFVGIHQGQYLPIIILPIAQLHQLYSFQTTIVPIDNLAFESEYAASSFDQNRFSSINDNANNGSAVKLNLHYSPHNIKMGSTPIGSFDILLSERYKEKTFFAFDRDNDIEFGRKWSTDSLLGDAQATEEIREGKLSYLPIENIVLSSSAGTLERANQFSSVRYDGLIEIKKADLPQLLYYAETISGKEKTSLIKNTWFRQKANSQYTFYHITPSLRFEEEQREVSFEANDSLASSSYAFTAYAPKLSAENTLGFDLSSEFEWRVDEALDAGTLIPQSNSFTQNYSVALREVKDFSASTIVTLREKKYEPAFQATNVNQQTTLVKLQSRYRPFSQGVDIDLFYDAATERTAKFERIFYKVRKGEGQYVWTDFDSDGVVDVNDEREFKLDRYDGEYNSITINSDNLIPVINIKASSRIRIAPDRFIKQPVSPMEKILTVLSSESYFRLEERSTEPNTQKIYLLNPDYLLRPATTQFGFQFLQQDLFFFENNPAYSFRFRFNQRKGLSQYSSGLERNYSRERSIRSRFQVSNEISNQTDIVLKNDHALSSSLLNQSRQIVSTTLATDFSYRPGQNVEVGFKIDNSQSEDRFSLQPVVADFNGQTIRTVFAFQNNGQIRVEFSREEVLISNQPDNYSVPYELTSGRESGKNYLWTISSEYRISGNVQFSLYYSGRTTSRSVIVHNGRMEVRAFF